MTKSEQNQTNHTAPKQKKSSRKLLELVPIFTGVLTVVVSAAAALYIARQDANSSQALIRRADLQIAITEVRGEILQLKISFDDVRNQIRDLGKPVNPFDQSIQLKSLNNAVAESQKRLASLEGVILNSPEKALAIPLITKDIESLKENHQTNIAASKQDIDRIYDQSKWFIGLMITSSIGIIALAISNYFKK